MEFCMEAIALKSSLRRELSVKSTQQQVFFEDYGVVGAVSAEDFSVDDLLDLSSGDFDEGFGHEVEDKGLGSVWSHEPVDEDGNSNVSNLASTAGESDDFLAVPDDDVAELEWVSRFVDDSVPELSLLYPAGAAGSGKSQPVKRSEPGLRPGSVNFPCFSLPVPVKARTKRPRAAGRRLWSGASSSFTDSSSSTSSCSSGTTSCLTSTEALFPEPPAAKKQKKKAWAQDGDGGQFTRRCSHCLAQKTPQWRTGPEGPKTLCNACGVRFKSGRLFPEYRPACSPTFSREVHSSSHRKVLEMRKRKEVVGPETGLTQVMIQSC